MDTRKRRLDSECAFMETTEDELEFVLVSIDIANCVNAWDIRGIIEGIDFNRAFFNL